LGRDDDEAREALWLPALEESAKPLPASRWWSDRRFAAWLVGASLSAYDVGDAFDPALRVQARVGIRPEEFTADEHALFSHDVVETLEGQAEWAIGLEVSLPAEDSLAVATLGSDSRTVRVEALAEPVFDPPTVLMDAFRSGSSGLRILVVSPACFARGWLPDGMERHGAEFQGKLSVIDSEIVLRAAIVPRPVHISGWDMAAGTAKPVARMVPPGSVYFFERKDGRPFNEDDARALWLPALGARIDEGFGRVVPGVWRPARSKR
jgi:CRISPR-associated protein Cmr3